MTITGGVSYYSQSTLAPGTNTSDLLSALIDLRTGMIFWQNRVFFRDAPKDGILEKSLEMLYSNFPIAQKEVKGR
jgi:hypothetical protein